MNFLLTTRNKELCIQLAFEFWFFKMCQDFIIKWLPPTVSILILSSLHNIFSMTCLLTCFKLLITTKSPKTIFWGQINNTDDAALICKQQHQLNLANCWQMLTNPDRVFKIGLKTRADFLHTLTTDRSWNNYDGGLYSDLSKIIDTSNSVKANCVLKIFWSWTISIWIKNF